MEYDIFREELAIKYPAYGHALWEPGPGGRYDAVEIGDVGFIREGYFHRLFNVLLPENHESHQDGVPQHHEPLVLRTSSPTNTRTLQPNNFRSNGVSDMSYAHRRGALGPDEAEEFSFSCSRRRGAILSLPLPAQRKDTAIRGAFAKCIIKYIDDWYAFARDRGLGISREDIILVTGCHLARSWANIAFQGTEVEHVSFGVQATGNSEVNWRFTPEGAGGVPFNLGPSGSNLPENQCIFIRGFRVSRFTSKIFPWLRGAAGPARLPEGAPDPDAQLLSIPADTHSDPLHTLMEYIATQAPECDMALVHDDDLLCINSASLESLRPDIVMSRLRESAPTIREVQCDCSPTVYSDKGASTAEEPPRAAIVKVATLSNHIFEAPAEYPISESMNVLSSPPIQPQDPGDNLYDISVTIAIPNEIHYLISIISSTLGKLAAVLRQNPMEGVTVVGVATALLTWIPRSKEDPLSAILFTFLFGRVAWHMWSKLSRMHHRLDDVFGKVEALQQSIESVVSTPVVHRSTESVRTPTGPNIPPPSALPAASESDPGGLVEIVVDNKDAVPDAGIMGSSAEGCRSQSTPIRELEAARLSTLSEIKQHIEQFTECRPEGMSHLDESEPSDLISLRRFVVRLLMLGALLFPADFASPIGYLGPQESTPYYPTGDLQRDRSVAFTTAVGCLDDLGVFLGKDNVRIADKLFKLAQALSDLGFREYALTVSDFALDVIEHLYFVAPNNYRPYVASVLSLRANIFCDLKRNDEAIDAADQAVKLCREHRVSQATPVPELPYASLNHALLLSSMGLKDESATVASELLNELDKSWPDLKDISALCKLCLSTACMGADEDMALSMAEETIKFGRTSSDADTQAVLAGALLNQSKILLSRGQKDAAVSVSAEAVTIFRAMSTTRSVFSIFLAHALDIHALHLSEVNRKSDSYSIRRDAVELWEALWISTPVPIGLPFARSLFELAKFRHKNKERTVLNEELRIARRAVDMFRQVMPLDGPGLGDALYLLADRVFELDRNGEGATYAEESVRHFREASSKDPKYALDLILSLSLASSCLACTDRADDAFEYAKQAVEVQYQREGAEDERYEAHLRKLLMDVVFRGMEIDQQDEVYPWFKELLLLGGSRGRSTNPRPHSRDNSRGKGKEFKKETSFWMDKDTDASGSNNGSTSTAVARSSTPSSDKVRLEGKAITPLPESEIHIPRFGIRKSKPINPSLDSGTPKRRLADKELFNARTAGLQNIRPLEGNILSSGQGGNSLLSDLDNTARISDVGTRRLSTGKHRKSSRSHWLPTLREIKQKTEQATSGGRLKRMSHSDQNEPSNLVSLRRYVVRLLMLGASLSPADFTSPIGYLGPPESTPYYPTGDLGGDRNVAFTTVMNCLEHLEANLHRDDDIRIALKIFELAQALSDLGLREYALDTCGFALGVLESPHIAEATKSRLHVASVLSLRAYILCDLKRSDEANDAANRAVKICKAHRKSQATPIPELARALLNYAVVLNSIGLREESAAVALEVLHELDESWPDAKDVSALCKFCLSTALIGVDDDMARSLAEETIKVTCTSSDANSQAMLAGALLAESKVLSTQGKNDTASAASAKAVMILRNMSTARPVFSLFLAHALDTHAHHLLGVNHKGESHSVRRDAVELWQTLKTTAGGAVARPLAWSLFELAKFRHKDNDRNTRREGLRLAEAAVDAFRQVVPLDAPGLGDALYLLAERMLELDLNREAVVYAEESVYYFREASSKDPKYKLDLIFSLSLASACLACTERAGDAFEYAKQAVEVQHGRIDVGDERYDAHLRKLLMDVVFRATEMDKQDEAIPWFSLLQKLQTPGELGGGSGIQPVDSGKTVASLRQLIVQ